MKDLTSLFFAGKKLNIILFATIAFAFSFFIYTLSVLYINGDQFFYHEFYSAMSEHGLSAYAIMPNYIGASEPVYFAAALFGAMFFDDKNIYFGIVNSIFIITLSILIYRSKAYSKPWFIFLFLSNFYVFVLLLSAERNKVSLLFMMMSLIIINDRKLTSRILMILGLGSHFSSVMLLMINLISIKLGYISAKNFFLVKKKYLVLAPFLMGLFVVALVSFYGIVSAKLNYYMGDILYIEAAKVIVLLFVAPFCVRKTDVKAVCLMLIFFVIPALFIGGGRMVMLSFLSLSYYALNSDKVKPVFVGLLLYYSLKSISFIYNIYEYGNGFGDAMIHIQ